MAGNGTTYQDIILFREYFQDLQTFHFHLFVTCLTSHTHTLENASRIRGTTNRTRSSASIVLSVRCFTDTRESMTFYNTLETFTFGGTYYFDCFAFCKYICGDGFTKGFLYVRVAELFYKSFRGGACLREVIKFSFGSVLLFLLTK